MTVHTKWSTLINIPSVIYNWIVLLTLWTNCTNLIKASSLSSKVCCAGLRLQKVTAGNVCCVGVVFLAKELSDGYDVNFSAARNSCHIIPTENRKTKGELIRVNSTHDQTCLTWLSHTRMKKVSYRPVTGLYWVWNVSLGHHVRQVIASQTM